MLWGITDKPVVVFTDNKALSAFLQSPTIPSSLCKYVDRLLQFKFVLAHVAGENNPVADYLSRMYINPHLTMELEIGTTIPVHQVEVRLKPHIQTEPIIPNEDGSPPTPSPPASPRPNSDDEDIDTPQANNIIPTTGSHNRLPPHTLQISHIEKLTPSEAHALSVPDPINISATKKRKNITCNKNKTRIPIYTKSKPGLETK